MSEPKVLFESFRLAQLQLRNRAAVAPLTRVSAHPDGRVTKEMVDYYAAYARGGFGLIFTEGTYTDLAFSQCYRNQPGIATAEHAASWRPVVDAAHAAGARIILQLMHAGALSQHNPYREETIAPYALRPRGEQMTNYYGAGPYRVPRAITSAEVEEAVQGFARAAAHARAVGFDGVEIHGANGYLVDQFLTAHTNPQAEVHGRVGFAAQVLRAVRASVGEDYLVGIRISQAKVNDSKHKWAGAQRDAEVIFAALRSAGANYIHTAEPNAEAPAFGEGPSLASIARKVTGLSVVANGGLHDPRVAARFIERGEADLVSLGTAALANSDWPNAVAEGREIAPFDARLIHPMATLENSAAFAATLSQARQRLLVGNG